MAKQSSHSTKEIAVTLTLVVRSGFRGFIFSPIDPVEYASAEKVKRVMEAMHFTVREYGFEDIDNLRNGEYRVVYYSVYPDGTIELRFSTENRTIV